MTQIDILVQNVCLLNSKIVCLSSGELFVHFLKLCFIQVVSV